MPSNYEGETGYDRAYFRTEKPKRIRDTNWFVSSYNKRLASFVENLELSTQVGLEDQRLAKLALFTDLFQNQLTNDQSVLCDNLSSLNNRNYLSSFERVQSFKDNEQFIYYKHDKRFKHNVDADYNLVFARFLTKQYELKDIMRVNLIYPWSTFNEICTTRYFDQETEKMVERKEYYNTENIIQLGKVTYNLFVSLFILNWNQKKLLKSSNPEYISAPILDDEEITLDNFYDDDTNLFTRLEENLSSAKINEINQLEGIVPIDSNYIKKELMKDENSLEHQKNQRKSTKPRIRRYKQRQLFSFKKKPTESEIALSLKIGYNDSNDIDEELIMNSYDFNLLKKKEDKGTIKKKSKLANSDLFHLNVTAERLISTSLLKSFFKSNFWLKYITQYEENKGDTNINLSETQKTMQTGYLVERTFHLLIGMIVQHYGQNQCFKFIENKILLGRKGLINICYKRDKYEIELEKRKSTIRRKLEKVKLIISQVPLVAVQKRRIVRSLTKSAKDLKKVQKYKPHKIFKVTRNLYWKYHCLIVAIITHIQKIKSQNAPLTNSKRPLIVLSFTHKSKYNITIKFKSLKGLSLQLKIFVWQCLIMNFNNLKLRTQELYPISFSHDESIYLPQDVYNALLSTISPLDPDIIDTHNKYTAIYSSLYSLGCSFSFNLSGFMIDIPFQEMMSNESNASDVEYSKNESFYIKIDFRKNPYGDFFY
ncbi:uncharacterized protein ASCRUDRAFT_6180 [Ascoidea rubescens DSM 1968]|uniref:Uncharacterized protein n=1 Tax=Ascoidea rubescens DSM 1968 TaxID=1344418 RepID=A0A1D2VRU7_9ASCO|nr:hypothetical protein ASCRUDRAFT_6180 [Ascoidea rubescens DSM 1968]ODV64342.1 hypothetical protein ASCRUDRAFT_6180 [Ascoidea rubescens DSM 1968]